MHVRFRPSSCIWLLEQCDVLSSRAIFVQHRLDMADQAKVSKKQRKINTRNSASQFSKLVGGPAEFVGSEVPTLRDCLRYFVFIKNQNVSNYSMSKIFNQVVDRIIDAWANSNCLFCAPVTISKKGIFTKLKRAYTFYNNSNRRQRKTQRWQKRTEFELDKLFDILVCQCKILHCEEDGAPCKDPCKVRNTSCSDDQNWCLNSDQKSSLICVESVFKGPVDTFDYR